MLETPEQFSTGDRHGPVCRTGKCATGSAVACLLFALAVLSSGCAHTNEVAQSVRASVYRRATVRFAHAVLVKPEDFEQPWFGLAPLILQEATSTKAPPETPRTVYFWRTSARMNDEAMDQFNYVWSCPETGKHAPMLQGVRITTNHDGNPVIWEVLQDRSGARILFVSQSLEARAMQRFPAPLAGRRYWVERSVIEAPKTVVARIIDESSVPMGPILYLKAGSHDVSTLICRCMDAQANEIVGMDYYSLKALDETTAHWLSQNTTSGITRWLPGSPADNFSRWLRLESP